MDHINNLRVVSRRANSKCCAEPREYVIRIDRDNKILGNRHVMQNGSLEERSRVIELYRQDLEKDLSKEGPMYLTLKMIAHYLIHSGKRIALQCWCSPLPCHGDLLVPVILDMVEKIEKETS